MCGVALGSVVQGKANFCLCTVMIFLLRPWRCRMMALVSAGRTSAHAQLRSAIPPGKRASSRAPTLLCSSSFHGEPGPGGAPVIGGVSLPNSGVHLQASFSLKLCCLLPPFSVTNEVMFCLCLYISNIPKLFRT